jgi:hypothetical protein
LVCGKWPSAPSKQKTNIYKKAERKGLTASSHVLGYLSKVCELEVLDTKEFETALDYWMERFNFVYQSKELIAYDESIYPDARNKQSGHSRMSKFHSNKVPSGRDRALALHVRHLSNIANISHM